MLFSLDHHEVSDHGMQIFIFFFSIKHFILSQFKNRLLFIETGTRWKDYILVTLLLSAIIGCWYAYQQNKNAKRHLRRMAQDMEGLQRAEQSLQEMQKV